MYPFHLVELSTGRIVGIHVMSRQRAKSLNKLLRLHGEQRRFVL